MAKILSQIRNSLILRYEKSINKSFLLLSNNCWGVELYKSLSIPYNSPMIGSYVQPNDYLHILKNLDELASTSIQFSFQTRCGIIKPYPIGMWGPHIQLHFIHETDLEIIRLKSQRRLTRMKKYIETGQQVFAKFDDRECATPDHFRSFHHLDRFAKISFSIRKYVYHDNIEVNISGNYYTVGDGYSLYSKRYKYFDIVHFIKTGDAIKTSASKLFSALQS